MTEGGIRLFGTDTHVPKSRLPLILGGALIVGYLALRPKPATISGPSLDQGLAASQAQAASTSLEFYNAMRQSDFEIAQLTSMNMLQSQALQNEYSNSQAGQRMCIPLSTWYNLDPKDRKALSDRVTNGQLQESAGPGGICFTPTTAGQMGYMPYTTTKESNGLFGSSYSTTGPAGSNNAPSQLPQPGLFALIDAIFRSLNQPVF